MKIGCHCGEVIRDQTDYLAYKAHLTPDLNWFGVLDGIDEEVIDPVASGQLSVEDAYMMSRRIVASPTRTMWQCNKCGRLYIEGRDSKLHCYRPENSEADKDILRGQ